VCRLNEVVRDPRLPLQRSQQKACGQRHFMPGFQREMEIGDSAVSVSAAWIDHDDSSLPPFALGGLEPLEQHRMAPQRGCCPTSTTRSASSKPRRGQGPCRLPKRRLCQPRKRAMQSRDWVGRFGGTDEAFDHLLARKSPRSGAGPYIEGNGIGPCRLMILAKPSRSCRRRSPTRPRWPSISDGQQVVDRQSARRAPRPWSRGAAIGGGVLVDRRRPSRRVCPRRAHDARNRAPQYGAGVRTLMPRGARTRLAPA